MNCRKRLFDLCDSVLALVFLAPVFVVIAAAIKVSDGGPVFFRQERIGLRSEA
ncbi:MAG: sugar transferase [Deltaproteobacteria bacterium]|nr:sugar transferase [Deltaproteobacteria bacterium]